METRIRNVHEAARSLWAKSDPFHPLWCHLIDVAATTQSLVRRFGGIAELPDSFVALVAGLHDLGKADPWFQNKAPELEESLQQQGILLPSVSTAICDGQRRFRHEARSADWVHDWLLGVGWGNDAAATIATAIHGHHGNFTTEFIYPEDDSSKALWDGWRRELFELLVSVLKPPISHIERFENASEVGAKLSGLIVLADWIASNEEVYRYDRLLKTGTAEDYFNAALAEAQAALKRLEFDGTVPTKGLTDAPAFCDIWPELSGKTLRPVQQLLEDLCRQKKLPPGLAIIEAPMGEGKTEAAIYLGECWNQQTQRRGCYLALPTQATANQIHQRYQRFLKARRPDSSAPRLVHGMAWLVDDVTPSSTPETHGDDTDQSRQLARDWFRPARRALLAEDGVGTVDQVLMAALNVKFGFLRLLGLSAKTLVIDEVHAYDEYMTTIMKRLLEWCRALRVNVVLLSATLSLRQKRELCESYAGKERNAEVGDVFSRWSAEAIPYPLVTSIPLDRLADAIPVEADRSRSRDIALQVHPGYLEDFDQTARLAVESIANDGCVCVLANTVKAAQAIFESLQCLQRDGSLANTELLLFHARFPACRRSEIETRVTDWFGKAAGDRRPRRAILVATQVVEQSLDVDFDVMLSQIAPVDLLLQRCGRVWRHERTEAERHGMAGPVLHVLLPSGDALKFGPSERVYDREILLRTLSLLHQRPCFNLPIAFRELIEGCYGGGVMTNAVIPLDELQRASETRTQKQKTEQSLARTHLLPIPSRAEFNPSGSAAEEGEGEAHSYFVAQTRLGDDSLSVLLIDDDQLLAIARSSLFNKSKPPRRELLKRLFLCKVGLPRWWLMSRPGNSKREIPSEPTDGCEAFFEGDNWLKHQIVLPLRALVPQQCSEWRGRDAQGREFIIRNDNVLGVSRQPLNPEGEDLHGQSQEEADAGQLG